MTAARKSAQVLSPSQRRAYCERLRKLWRDDPLATLDTAVKATGAPRPVAEFVRRQLVMAGTVPAHVHAKREVPSVAGQVSRQLCPRCLCGGGECDRCNGTGYVLKDPYDTRTSGEQRDDFEEVGHGG